MHQLPWWKSGRIWSCKYNCSWMDWHLCLWNICNCTRMGPEKSNKYKSQRARVETDWEGLEWFSYPLALHWLQVFFWQMFCLPIDGASRVFGWISSPGVRKVRQDKQRWYINMLLSNSQHQVDCCRLMPKWIVVQANCYSGEMLLRHINPGEVPVSQPYLLSTQNCNSKLHVLLHRTTKLFVLE